MIPRLYAIADAQVLRSRRMRLEDFAQQLHAAGVRLVQYRDKLGLPQEILHAAAVLQEAFAGSGATLIMNDRADLAVLAGFDGVHVGQGDLSPEDARRVMAARKEARLSPDHGKAWEDRPAGQAIAAVVGVSTHTEEQVRAAELSCADYVAIGPAFATGTKLDAEQVVGLDGIREARVLTAKPLVAIGGISRSNARSVIEAGADSVAVISGLFGEGDSVEQVARDFLELLR
jgi:thiamine-phosphate pyrophosphorylase